jgi:predicted TIM-barrel fold metal-dependent hydrolase
MKIIDAHTHVFPQYADLAVRVMDRIGINYSITLEWHDGFGSTLQEHIKIFSQYPGRFVVFGNVDFRRINEQNFAREAAQQMEKDVESGMQGLKIYKALGLEYRHPDGTFWKVNDERLDPIWEKAGELGIPVLIHTADPSGFWQPMKDLNFWNGVVCGEYAWWDYYRKGYPSRDELLGERNEIIKRHPKTIFICPHVGSRADCLDSAADDLDALPNLYYDISARIPLLGMSARRAEHSRRFLIEYADRILFGTDSIYDDTNVPTGVQAQCLFQPYEIPLEGADPREKYIETSVEFLQSNLDFLLSDTIQTDPPFKRNRAGYSIRGLRLPNEVCEKLLYENVERILLNNYKDFS